MSQPKTKVLSLTVALVMIPLLVTALLGFGLSTRSTQAQAQETWTCGVAEPGRAPGGGPCKWNHAPVRFALQIPQIADLGTVNRILWEVSTVISEHSGTTVTAVPPNASPNILGQAGPTGNALAWAYLPCGNVSTSTRLTQLYGTGVNWSRDPSLLPKVVLHETLHSMGLGHSNSTSDIMYPTIGPSTRYGLGPGDVRGLQERYGPPTIAPQPPKPDPVPQPPAPPPTPTPQPRTLPWPDRWSHWRGHGYVPIYDRIPSPN